MENFFGRMCQLWGLMHKRFRWNYEKYGDWVTLAVALTNFHIMHHPLRDEDGIFYKRVLQNMENIAAEQQRKRKMTQKKYQINRKAKLAEKMFVGRVADANDEEDEESESDTST